MQNEDIAFLSRVDENGDTATCLSARKLRHNIWPMEDDLFHHKSLESRILKREAWRVVHILQVIKIFHHNGGLC